MALKLDDFLSKKKEPAQVLDLSRVKITSKEDLKKYLERVPEYKIKPEKVLPEMVKIREKDWGVAPGRREAPHPHPFQYLDPTPPDMKSIQLADLCPVTIDWKMLTTLRPKTKMEEDLFSRLVQLGKLDLKHQQQLARSKDTDWVRKTKNPRSSIVETRVLSCPECCEDFCDGSACCKLMYDNFLRPQASTATGVMKGPDGGDEGEVEGRRKKRRGRPKTRGFSGRKLRKNSIFNRPPTRGCTRDHSKRERHAAAVRSRSTSRDRVVSGGGGRPSRRRHRKQNRSASPTPRAKSAPRIHFQGLSDSGGERTRRSYRSRRSAVSSSSFTSGTDGSDTEPAEGNSRRFVRHCTLNYPDNNVWSDPYQYPHTYKDVISGESDSSPSAHRTFRPATIHLELGLEYPEDVSFVAPPKSSDSAMAVTSVSKMATGLSRVQLSLPVSAPPHTSHMVRNRPRIRHNRVFRKSEPVADAELSAVYGYNITHNQ